MPLKWNAMRCKNQTDFGDLTFVINGFEYTLPNDDWVEKSLDIPDPTTGAQISDSQKMSQLTSQTKIYSIPEYDGNDNIEAA